MKRVFATLIIIMSIIAFPALSMSAPGYTTAVSNTAVSAQVTVGTSPTLVAAAIAGGRNSLTIQNQGVQAVYCSPDASISTSTGGLLLLQYMSFTTDRASAMAWYCIVSTDTTTVGVIEER